MTENEIVNIDQQISKRSEYIGRNSPGYCKSSLIKELDEKLKQTFPGYKLIAYGILPMPDNEDL